MTAAIERVLNMADEGEILDSWEELDDKEVLNKQLEGLKVVETKKRTTAEVSILQEDTSRTQYTPQVRILKRQIDDSSTADKNAARQNQPQKSLQQREAEYKEARLRILGENYSGEDNSNNCAAPVENSRPVKLVKSSEDLKLQQLDRVKILREPRGPDGTTGFDQPRSPDGIVGFDQRQAPDSTAGFNYPREPDGTAGLDQGR